MDYKSFSIKAATGEGRLIGRASPFGGDPDSYGDVIAEHAYDKTLSATGGVYVVTANHDLTKTIGKAKAVIGKGGLDVEIQLAMELQDAKDAFIRAKEGLSTQLSIGYSVEKASYRKDGVRVLEEIRLFEIALVPHGAAGDRAQLTSVKHRDDEIQAVLDTLERNIKAWKDEIAVKDTVHMLFELARAERAISRINELVKG